MTDTTPYSVPQEPGRWRAIALAAVVHAALFAFLWIGIRWQSQTPVTLQAEVWDMQAKDAAPVQMPPPLAKEESEPEPEPVKKPEPKPVVKAPPLEDPKIALEQEKKKKEKARLEEEKQAQRKAVEEKAKLAAAEKQKADADKKQKADALAKKQKDEADKKRKADQQQEAVAAKFREEDMRKLTAGTGGSGDAPKTQGMRGDAGYAGKIAAKIKSNTAFAVPPDLQGNPTVEYDVQLFPDGSLRGPPRKVKSSGIPAFDEAVRRAIELSQPYPADKSGTVPAGFPVIHRAKEQ